MPKASRDRSLGTFAKNNRFFVMTPLAYAILRRIRIYPPLLIGALMSSVVITSMVLRFTITDMVILPFALLAMFGGILALLGFKAGNWMLLCASLAPFAENMRFLRRRILIPSTCARGFST